jgi:replicative superfamily II helicase
MIDDDHRGYLLELAATKLLTLEQDVQIVGMSATLPVRLPFHISENRGRKS